MGGSSTSRNQSSLLEDTHPSRSIISRLFSRSKTRHITDFHIRPVDPHRKYAAGDHVTGAVVLTVLRPIRITHLTVALHGFVKVYKGPNSAHEAPFNPSQIASGVTVRTRYFGNGLASLFQDEQVLSADGKLEAGRYEFNFDLVFPSKVNLPTSIDFERGTISYMIAATLTRPTSISPTTVCDRKIYLVEKVDIGSIPAPRPRTISLEPISRRSRRKKTDRSNALGGVERVSSLCDPHDGASSEFDSSRAPESVTTESNAANDAANEAQQQTPQSPTRTDIHDVMSEVSTESAVTSSSAGASVGYKVSEATGSSAGSQVGARTPTVEEKTITASVEMLKGGSLPGDFVPIKVSVHHIKRIKSVHGVIATLFRQGRIDSAPPISAFQGLSKEEVRRLEKEEYFPRSKTGLSGLSLSSAGSCSVFRKDLSQVFGPLIIDPITLDASVTISVRVPEDSFPTIKGVPGELISFKYQLEVIVDLGGKLASQISSGQSKAGGISGGGALPSIGNPYESSSSIMGNWGSSIIDTDQLRRHKGVISVVFEVPVGTVDSSRQRTRGGSLRPNPQLRQLSQATEPQPTEPVVYGSDDKRPSHPESTTAGYVYAHDGTSPGASAAFVPSPFYTPSDPHPHQYPTPIYVPPPDVPDDACLSEKERARRAEQRLLPSRPPNAPAEGMSSQAVSEDIYNVEDANATAGPSSGPSVPGTNGVVATAPTMDEVEACGAAGGGNSEDKLERERRRLLEEASAPPDFPEDYDTGAPGPSSPGLGTSATAPAISFQPSAPILSEHDDEPGGSYLHESPIIAGHSGAGTLGRVMTEPVEQLPRYQR